MRTKAIIVALLVCLSAPQLGCASVAKQGSGSTERAATAVKNKDKKKPSEEKAAQTSGTKTEEKKEADGKDQKSDDSKKGDNKSSDSSKSDNKGDSSQSKQNSGSNNSSSNGGSQKKWVAEQGLLGDRLQPGLGAECGVYAPSSLLGQSWWCYGRALRFRRCRLFVGS